MLSTCCLRPFLCPVRAQVAAGAPVLLVHCATQKPLCLEAARYPNDYGVELEVSARSALGPGLKLAMEQMAMVRGRGAEEWVEVGAGAGAGDPVQGLVGRRIGFWGAWSCAPPSRDRVGDFQDWAGNVEGDRAHWC